MRLACLLAAAAFGLVAIAGDAHAQATPPDQKMLESAGKSAKKAVTSTKRAKKSSRRSNR